MTPHDTVLAVLAEVAPEADLDELDPDVDLRLELDLDSIDFLNFVVGIDERTGIEIPERDYPQLGTLRACTDYLSQTRPMTATSGHYHDLLDDLREPTRGLRHQVPAAWTAFTQLHEAAMADGVLPGRVKELMALVASVVKRCDGCIAYHAKAAARRGATPEEVAEALAVALLMDGGVASVYAPRAWAAYEEFAAPGSSAIA